MFDAPLRPLSDLDVYPEREAADPGWAERAWAAAAGHARVHFGPGAAALRGMVARVQASEETLAGATEADLDRATFELRQRVGYAGLTDELAARAFALVRLRAQRVLGMRPFDVQVLGGWAILKGMVAEMQTGEGKTMTATLPACAAALAGVPVHVVTVNDYLVERDATTMAPLYESFGLSVGTITEGMLPQARRDAYTCDVTYCTNKQLVFDYLKDRLVIGRHTSKRRHRLESLQSNDERTDPTPLLRGLCFAIVDEADSVLVDEARTPLILSRAVEGGEQEAAYRHAIELARTLRPGVHYRADPNEHKVELTPAGERVVAEAAPGSGAIWSGARWREALIEQALSAIELFIRDRHYLVRDDKVQIIDEYTGRTMPDRSWERGLHQLVEAKEGCEITTQPETLARISYQRFFRRYLHLGGMSGTVREVAGELSAVYGLRVLSVPTNRPCIRAPLPETIHVGENEKWAAVAARVTALHVSGRPVLVGTRSVEASERIGRLLEQYAIPHEILNARQDENEAEIVARAGQPGRVTVATNMAGRGTDIQLGPGVASGGGLHVIVTERHDARRIDRQLIGRCARQGDPGSYEVITSLDDELYRHFYRGWTNRMLRGLPALWTRGRTWLWAGAAGIAQRAAERRHSRARRGLLETDQQLDRAMAFSGRGE